ncbi:YbhB/YbcL family Raf kinase inhibitor-like protein NDAI_0D04770 [Naumovozyma dairenensis CBS 421]|uniref:Carboxypeptidase Y inhibitor n=1 Tax=Naumovozyma dairenensis (strain ATCC 10597 / BCRC 20456 / CBS 421 / NBRC 0211 / NRRL Y-12639) TaxID=1071378 RepID=G0WAH9_NAUDC|nr:hypothetical protein NDAI_0D04770 [Naumovozyma dairenensis CBS 421]CCD24790.1 hypothetical protein NDAI_0D04770 [Naumovozyma dairenensis CBS 421]
MATILKALKEQEVIPDVIKNEQFQPVGEFAIKYTTEESKVLNAQLGSYLTPLEAKSKPTTINVKFFDESLDLEHDRFTFVMTDPDAPSRTDKTYSEYCHYVETDIDLSKADAEGWRPIGNGKVVSSYIGPGPPPKTGKHRYVFLLYKQPRDLTKFTEVKGQFNWGYGIPGVGANKWASENKLDLVAADFFFSENTD